MKLYATASSPVEGLVVSDVPPAARAWAEAARRTPRDDWWSGGDVPILVIQGLEDRIAPPESGRRLRAEYPHRVRLVEIDGAAHALLAERFDRVAAEVLAELTTPSSA